MTYRTLVRALTLTGVCFAALVSSATAANPPLLTATPEDGTPGSSAGRLRQPYGIATNPSNGHIYVSDSKNNRIAEFTAWGVFVKSFGWGVDDGSAELQVCTSSCEAGIAGADAGQLDAPGGLVIDSTGEIYVVDANNFRVVKFSPEGDFLLTFGYEVNKTTGADVCTAADVTSGDECGAGLEGTEPAQFSGWTNLTEGRALAVGPSGDIYVGDNERIQVFSSSGVFQEVINFSEIAGLPDGDTKSFVVASDGTIYLAFVQSYALEIPQTPDVYHINPSTKALLGKIEISWPKLLALDASGNLYVAAESRVPQREEVLIFDPAGECIVCFKEGFASVDPYFEKEMVSLATGDACGPTDIYVGLGYPRLYSIESDFSQLVIYGDPPNANVCPPPAVPPSINEQFASSVGTTSATVRAGINPHFWPDTTYYVEYGTEDCATSTCLSRPVPPASLTGQVVDATIKSAGVLLPDLEPETTYFFRFVSESGGGGPVTGPSGSFTTFPASPGIADSCGNEGFRFGAGQFLPDCRAYEMVSPLDKEGGDVMTLKNVFGYPASMNQVDLTGNKLTYSSARAFGDPEASPYTSQYMATRGVSGWSTEPISPQRNGPVLERGRTTDTEYKAFTPDLCMSWLRHDTDPPLAGGAPAGYANFYRRNLCSGGYEALRTPTPPTISATLYQPELQGYSADGSTAVFIADDKLTADAPADTAYKLYESRIGEEPNYVCILPGNVADTGGCSAGTDNTSGGLGRTALVQGALSDDGSLIYWSDRIKEEGKIYLRVEGTTLKVSAAAETEAGTTSSRFWAASADGTPESSQAIITTGGRLYEVEPLAGAKHLIATQVDGVAGVSRDASDVYFVSEADLDGGGAAEAGKPNLYHYERSGEDRTTTFAAEVSDEDGQETTLGLNLSMGNQDPVKHGAQVSSDGNHLVFMSNVSPAIGGSDNRDVNSGEPDTQVYLYDAEAGEVLCISCNPTGARPLGEVPGETTLWVSAKIQPWQNQLQAPRVISDQGTRVFFESKDALAPRDTNAEMDVYEWERGGTGGCTTSQVTFNPAAGGCVDLISSGTSDFPSELVDATPSGDDVFIGTLEGLVPQDYGLVDIYDARVGGGFAPPPPPPPTCDGASCQNPPPPPAAPSPASANFVGPGSPPQKVKPRCPKGKRLVKKHGKTRCVKKKKKRAGAGKSGRNGR